MLLQSPVLQVTTSSGTTYSFDHADYDVDSDRMHLTCGPPTAASAAPTREGHVIRTAAPDGYFCGLTLVDVGRRLHEDGHITITFSPSEWASLGVADIAQALSGSGGSGRGRGRFRRAAPQA
jgi:hypothetical protein